MRRNYIVLSTARTGSTYITAAIAKQLRCLEPNTFYGGEYFRWKEYFQIGQSSSRSPGNFDQLVDQPYLHDKFDKSNPKGMITFFYIGDAGTVVREQRQTSWSEVAPVTFRKCFNESQRRMTLLENTAYPWVIKLFPEHTECLDINRLNQVISRQSTALIIVYRSFLWDWFLSMTAVAKSGVYNEQQSNWEKPQINPTEVQFDMIKSWFTRVRLFLNLINTYRHRAEYIVPYEDFSGEPSQDACSITGINVWPQNADHQAKLWTTEEKESMISNLDHVKEWFSNHCKLMGYPNGRLHI